MRRDFRLQIADNFEFGGYTDLHSVLPQVLQLPALILIQNSHVHYPVR